MGEPQKYGYGRGIVAGVRMGGQVGSSLMSERETRKKVIDMVGNCRSHFSWSPLMAMSHEHEVDLQ